MGLALSACGRTRLDLYEDGGPSVDGGFDASNEAGLDSGRDGGSDSGRDGGLEAGVDGGPQCPGCDDGIACTDETCDPATGECSSVPNAARCEVGQLCVPGVGCQAVPCGLDERCDDGIFCNGAEQCVNGLCVGGGLVRCRSDQCSVGFCHEPSRACLSRPVDNDGDGFGPLECMGGDCDDSDPNVSPRAPEVCNDRRDNDCDLAVDCADVNCANADACTPPPPFETSCDNRVDDDRDGLVDCADGDCAMNPECFFPPPPRETNCTNRVDDDRDGRVDCNDSDCLNDPACIPPPPRETNCDNRVDDDRDGLVDCADSDCAMTPVCIPPPPRETNCNNRVDDDRDGLVDCADSDCARNPLCLSNTCPTIDLGNRQGRLVAGTTVGGRSERFPPCLGSGQVAPEVTHLWRVPQTGTWVIDTVGSNYDTALYVLAGGCNGASLACNDDAIGLQSQVTLRLSAGQTVVIVVDGFGSDSGNYVLNATLLGSGSEFGFCSDGRDNDGDGLADCADGDCLMDPVCFMPSNEFGQCSDGADNDNDGAVDCFDFDCATDPFCAMMPSCPDRDLASATGSPVATDSTSGRGDDFVPNCTSFNSGAPDVAYHWRAPSAGRWAFDTIGSSYDTALSVLRTCNGPVLACNDDISGGNLASQVSLPLVGGEEVVIVVDGWGESVGRYVLNINRIVTNERGLCADMIDNDGDGALDCTDSDCANDAACQPVCDPTESGIAACNDGLDNDCDGLPDCADSDCNSPGGSECCNGVDDNGDGVVDLLACGCETDASCGAIVTPFGPVPGTCWPRTGTCGPDCSAFNVQIGNAICRIINPAWRCQRTTGQCVPAP